MSDHEGSTYPFRDINMEDRRYFCVHSHKDERHAQFKWKKPQFPDRDMLVSTLCYEQACFLDEVVKEKNKEIQILRKQLMKVNEMNYNLTKQLQRLERRLK
ncbi:uncharacterized protein [Haliotis cracherodii]|uniref:uncharacterized protein n=1 Tax=Haliotis cracherodii TaxID=6455 RepID=UPI0039EAC0E8